MLDPTNDKQYEGAPYPFGLDPMWQISTNKINFFNSYKMKISITFGIIHMLFGVALSLWNNRLVPPPPPLKLFLHYIMLKNNTSV